MTQLKLSPESLVLNNVSGRKQMQRDVVPPKLAQHCTLQAKGGNQGGAKVGQKEEVSRWGGFRKKIFSRYNV